MNENEQGFGGLQILDDGDADAAPMAPVAPIAMEQPEAADPSVAAGGEGSHARVLIIGSGNIVHNLPYAFSPQARGGDVSPADWALEFDERVTQLVLDGNHEALWNYERLGPAAQMAVPTAEHYLPLLYVLAASDDKDGISFACEDMEYGAISMRSILFGV